MNTARLPTPTPRPGPGARTRCRTSLGMAVVAASLLVACQASTGAAPGAAPLPGPATEAGLMAAILAEVGQAPCQNDSQCHTLPLGAKACGGPASWLAWSGAQARQARLQAWAGELAALQRQRLAASGMAGNCRYEADPGARCDQQRCVLRGADLPLQGR